MPIYEYECSKCGQLYERYFSIVGKPHTIGCLCGFRAKAIISASANRREWSPYLDENLGDKPVMVDGREHRKKLMKAANLEDQYHHKRGMPGQWV